MSSGNLDPLTGFTVRAPADAVEWEALCGLRWRVLRAPWGQPPGSELDANESVAVHRIALDEAGRVVGAGRWHRTGLGEGQVRYMAVEEAWRGAGVGSAILRALEADARLAGVGRMILNARVSVSAFYARRGYRETGIGPLLFGRIRHVTMAKDLGEVGG